MKKHYFCTLFDKNYLLKGVVMLRSLDQHCSGAHVFVLCMDEQTQLLLMKLKLPFITCIPLALIEDDQLLAVKKNRTIAEYCWTFSPCLPWYVLDKYPDIGAITYVDADLMFYSSLQPLFDEIGNASIAAIEHRFIPRLRHLEAKGRFCVEWVGFRRDAEGMACLRRWRKQCIEWCYARLEEGRMGDQKYLDEWPARYSSLHVLQYPGAGIAPWNYSQYAFSCDANGCPSVDGLPLIFYHFHQFQLLDNGKFDRLSDYYTVERAEPAQIYEMYEDRLKSVLAEVRAVQPDFSSGFRVAAEIASRRWVQRHIPRPVIEWFHRLKRN